MLLVLLVASIVLSLVAYRWIGAWLERQCGVEPGRPTPAHALRDDVDYVPTRAAVVFGHHFSSIAGAGPIVGPIVAAAAFGWAPTWLWIVLGSILVGGIHDFGATFLSIRTGGRSIVQTCRDVVGETTGRLFLVFVLLALVYVIIVFLDLTAAGFAATPATATASGWFVLCALGFGWLNGKGIPFGVNAAVFTVLTFLGLWIGHVFPATGVPKDLWLLAILVYCYLAAVLPVGVLMQPRDFLSATFLYAILLVGIVGVLLHGGGSFALPAFTGFRSEQLGNLVPFLFITVACGACSGFHSMVASGTTSKQVAREGDVRVVAYGGMLVEGVLAVFALGCLAVVGSIQGNPVSTFAQGASVFFGALGIPRDLGVEFASLAVSTFLLTTLDTCTRLARFLVEELFEWRSTLSRWLGTGLALAVPAALAWQTFPGPDGRPQAAWQALWPLFGATNQLLAALALVTFVVFLRSRGRPFGFALAPAVLMIVMPLLALGATVFGGQSDLLRAMAAAMFALGAFVVVQGLRYVARRTPA